MHTANVFGLPYKALSVTGIYIWWKKRAARVAHVQRAPAQHAPAE